MATQPPHPVADLVLSADAEPPAQRLFELQRASPPARRAWEQGPASDSADHELILAVAALRAGWPDQEVVDALIYWRHQHGEELQLREDYHALTILKASSSIRLEDAEAQLERTLLDPPEDEEEALKATLEALFGVDILQVLRYIGDPPTYGMITGQGEVTLGLIASIYNQNTFRQVTGSFTGVNIPKVSARAWEKRISAILKLAVDVGVGDASHPAQEARTWVTDYLLDRGVRDEEEWEKAIQMEKPFRRAERINLRLADFSRWLDVNRNVTLNSHEGGRKMRQIGSELYKVNVTIGSTRTSRSCWILNETFNADASTGRESARRRAQDDEELDLEKPG